MKTRTRARGPEHSPQQPPHVAMGLPIRTKAEKTQQIRAQEAQRGPCAGLRDGRVRGGVGGT